MTGLTKTCGFAGEDRPIEQFDTMGLGWQSYCRSCSIMYKAKRAELRATNPRAGATEVRAALGIPEPSQATGTRGPMDHRSPGTFTGRWSDDEGRTAAVPCLSTLGDEALALLAGRSVRGLHSGLDAYRAIMNLPVPVQEEYRIEVADRLTRRATRRSQ